MDRLFNVPSELGSAMTSYYCEPRTEKDEVVAPPAFNVHVIRTKSGKRRVIHAPNVAMARLHRSLNNALWGARPAPQRGKRRIATAFWDGSSVQRNLRPHLRSRFFYGIDIANAYETTSGMELAEILAPVLKAWDEADHGAGANVEAVWRRFLATYCLTKQGGLRFGSPSSPTLFNIFCNARLDPTLSAIAEQYKLVLTRYADDITVSSRRRIPEPAKRALREAVRAAGFEINPDKSFSGDLFAGHPIRITGVNLTWRGWHQAAWVSASRKFRRMLRWMLYQAVHSEEYFTLHAPAINGLWGVYRWTCKSSARTLDDELLELHFIFRRQQLGRRTAEPQPVGFACTSDIFDEFDD